MSELSEQLYEQAVSIGDHVSLPCVETFVCPPRQGPGERRNNFAFLRLVDGSVGLTYVALDQAASELNDQLPRLSLRGRSPVELADLYRGQRGWERALGLAAINAISQHLLSREEPLIQMPTNLEMMAPEPGIRVGMVGYFGRVVEPLREQGVDMTVIELDEALLRNEPGLEVTSDPSRLEGCAQVIITGTTLLNHTLDGLLPYCRSAREIHLLGPSASCLPDVLFAAGITSIGGFRVIEPLLFAERWAASGRWRDAGLRYRLTRDGYGGMARLLAYA